MFGLTKTYAAGTFSPTAIDAFMTAFKDALAADGAFVTKNDTEGFHWGVPFARPGNQTDDSPFWGITGDGSSGFEVFAYVGESGDIIEQQTSPATFINPSMDAHTLYAAASGGHGWWWIAARDDDSGSVVTLIAGVSSRRYPSDLQCGIVSRYGIVNLCYGPPWPCMNVPYATNASTGADVTNCKLTLF